MSDQFEDEKSKAKEIVMQALQTKDSRATAFENAFGNKSPEELNLQQSIYLLSTAIVGLTSEMKLRHETIVDASPEIVQPFKVGQHILCLGRSEERDYDGRIIGGYKCTKGTVYTCEGCVWHHKFGWLVVITDEMHAAEDFEAARV